jgi:hypothetical protein
MYKEPRKITAGKIGPSEEPGPRQKRRQHQHSKDKLEA